MTTRSFSELILWKSHWFCQVMGFLRWPMKPILCLMQFSVLHSVSKKVIMEPKDMVDVPPRKWKTLRVNEEKRNSNLNKNKQWTYGIELAAWEGGKTGGEECRTGTNELLSEPTVNLKVEEEHFFILVPQFVNLVNRGNKSASLSRDLYFCPVCNYN